ncbi:MAG: response regulator [Candidatus Hinthialibacter antarcticus]|nr:response regulator [Candidatus Hinthialibacter antarcticus]
MDEIQSYKDELVLCAQTVLGQMFNTETSVGESAVANEDPDRDAIGVAIRGSLNYCLIFQFSGELSQHLWNQQESNSVPSKQEHIDLLSEVSNQIAGSFKRILSSKTDLDLRLSLPQTLTKDEMPVTDGEKRHESINFSSDHGCFNLLIQTITSEIKDKFMRFLIVDDAQFMRNLIRKTLTKYGYSDFTEATSGDEAIDAASKEAFDIILMDWNMPVPGIDAVKAIRSMGIKTPIVMVTTEGEKMKVIKAVQAGANNYLIKPFTPDQLKEKIDQVVNK